MDTKTIDKDAVLTTEARRQIFNSLMQGMTIKEAAKGNMDYKAARNFVANCGINSLVRQEKAEIEAKAAEELEITKESQVRRFKQLAKLAEKAGQHQSAVMAEREVSKHLGFYEVDNAQKGFQFTMPGLRLASKGIDSEIVGNQPRLLGSASTEANSTENTNTMQSSGSNQATSIETPSLSGQYQGLAGDGI